MFTFESKFVCMIASMTGYGKATDSYESKKITIELKSLNSKQGDFIIRIPSKFREKELEIRSLLADHLVRGKVELNIHIDQSATKSNQVFNSSLAENYYTELKNFADQVGADSDIMSHVMRMPDILTSERESLSEEEWDFLKALLVDCIKGIQEFRDQEGAKLADDFKMRIAAIREHLTAVEKRDPERAKNVRERIAKHLSDQVGNEHVDENRFEQELIYYLEKLDITEEKVRLKAHCEYFMETLAKGGPIGKKLGFISQEIGREINTIGSKANDVVIQKVVVQMKDELEKIKEQVLNVL